MTDESAKPRGIIPILLIGLLLGPIFTMLWISRGRMALAYLALTIAAGIVIYALEAAGVVSSQPLFSSLTTTASLVVNVSINVIGTIHTLTLRNAATERKWFRWIAAVPFGIMVILALVALPVRVFFYQPFSMPSASNMPNMMVGDYFAVSKYAYGYSRFSFPFNLADFEGRIGGRHPQRGDMAVFKLPSNTDIDYVKRVIGLPGERLQLHDGVVHIDGQAVKRERIADFVPQSGEGDGVPVQQFVETLPNGVQYRVLETQSDGAADNTDEYLVPDGHYFVLGDNRDNSQDSRYLDVVGYIPEENFIGPASFRYANRDGFAFAGLSD